MLSSPMAQALRGERTSLLAWLTGIGAFALIIGVISRSVSSAGISKQLQRELAKLQVRGSRTAWSRSRSCGQLFGSLFGAPGWLVDVTPFAHVAAVPAQPFRVTAAAIMLASGVVAAAAALLMFQRRDLTGA